MPVGVNYKSIEEITSKDVEDAMDSYTSEYENEESSGDTYIKVMNCLKLLKETLESRGR